MSIVTETNTNSDGPDAAGGENTPRPLHGRTLAPEVLVQSHPGPALLFDAAGEVKAANEAGGKVAEMMTRGHGAEFRQAVARAAQGNTPGAETVFFPADDEGNQVFHMTLLPVAAGGEPGGEKAGGEVMILALGQDLTLDKNLTSALTASRQLFRDLVACSSDFAWETDANGAFSYVSRRGALGYQANSLNGRRAATFLHPDYELAGPLPFESREALEDVEIWLTDSEGAPACLLTSSVPVVGGAGEWLGARGVCRDVTETRRHERALAAANDRERLLSRIVDSIRNELEPQRMLKAAASATAWSIDAVHAWVLRVQPRAGLTVAAEIDSSEGGPDWAGNVKTAIDAMTARLVAKNLDQGEGPDDIVELVSGGLRLLAVVTRYRGQANGAICLARLPDGKPWDADERQLAAGVANHLGIAIEQINNHETLERLSRVDELTGLMNRRAFFDDATVRLQHHQRNRRPAALLFVDLDNFKQVNDTAGHDRGDEVLKALAEILRRNSRPGDLPVRFGGDEFGLWLEETDEAGAVAKAGALIAATPEIQAAAGDVEARLSLSIGIAVADSKSPETLEQLIVRADKGMYQVKKGGKGNYAVIGRGWC